MSFAMKNSTAVEWGRVWGSGAGDLWNKDIWRIIDQCKLDYLRPLLPRTGRSLEVGCGSARMSAMLAAQGYDTVCLDFSGTALTSARRNYDTVGAAGVLTQGDAYHLPFRDGSFDVVLSAGLLEHFEDPQPIVNEMVRTLRPGGVFYSDIVPRKFSLFRSLNFLTLGGSRQSALIYERGFTKAEIRSMLRDAGCGEVDVFPMSVHLPQKFFSRRVFPSGVIEYWANGLLQPLLGRLDKTWLADALGFLYFASGLKTEPVGAAARGRPGKEGVRCASGS